MKILPPSKYRVVQTSHYVREAILEHLDGLEDIYLAEKRLADIRQGRSKTIPLEDVMKRYDLED